MSSKHDKEVLKEAKRLKKKRWNVKADLEGFEKPSPVGKHRRVPDIETTKPGSRRIIEVERPTEDLEQIRSFEKSAKMRRRTKFVLKKVTKKK